MLATSRRDRSWPTIRTTLSSPSSRTETSDDRPLIVGGHTLHSRLIVGTGRYDTMQQMRDSLDARTAIVSRWLSAANGCTTARARTFWISSISIVTRCCPTRPVATPRPTRFVPRNWVARFFERLGNPGADWVKLEVLGDSKTLLPDPAETVAACRELAAEGFPVLCYTSDCPVTARRLKEVGAASVMPAGSPIGSGQGLLNPNNLRIILEYLKEDDPDLSGDRRCRCRHGQRCQRGVRAGRRRRVAEHRHRSRSRSGPHGQSHEARGHRRSRSLSSPGRIPKRLYGTASSPAEGVISTRPYGSEDLAQRKS